MPKLKNTLIYAETLLVLCPHPECGEAVPNPDNGADAWTPREVTQASGRQVTCSSCDLPFKILPQSRVPVA